ncbi:response regulator [Candidatus Thorarchaeota archaeon]|nr:MAG: response regulator [Candidatus Thorarchaeota archaeon]
MKIRVLVVDDDEDLLFLAGKFLAKEDDRFELVSANTDQEALQKIEEEEFDAIVCDHYLGPNSMTGLDLLEWVREGNPNIPFIIFTGRSQEAVAIRALNLGADYYLKKGSEEFRDLFIDIAHRIRTEVEERRTGEALTLAYEELERRVEERTVELQTINEQLINEISERRKVEEALNLQCELGNALCKTHDFNEALDLILKTAVRLDGIDCGGIYLADAKTGEFDLSSSQGISAHFLSKFSGDKGPASIITPLYLSSKQIQNSKEVEEQYKDLTAVALIPVHFEEETAAVLSLGSHSQKEIPSRDRHTLEAIAIQIAAYMARVKAEQTISERQTELVSVFDAFKYMFVVTNSEFEILSVNNVVSEYFGLEEVDIIGKPIDKIYKIGNDEKNNLQTAILSGVVIRLENQLADIGGESVRVETRVASGKQNNENILYFMSRPSSA